MAQDRRDDTDERESRSGRRGHYRQQRPGGRDGPLGDIQSEDRIARFSPQRSFNIRGARIAAAYFKYIHPMRPRHPVAKRQGAEKIADRRRANKPNIHHQRLTTTACLIARWLVNSLSAATEGWLSKFNTQSAVPPALLRLKDIAAMFT